MTETIWILLCLAKTIGVSVLAGLVIILIIGIIKSYDLGFFFLVTFGLMGFVFSLFYRGVI